MTETGKFIIVNLTKSNPPSGGLLLKKLKNAMLGRSYRLELIFMDPRDSQKLNLRYRKKNTPANVLSFSLSETEGEIVISPSYAAKEAAQHGHTKKNFIGYLFIHALLHLKGLRHGSTMEAEEKRFCKRFLPQKASSIFSYGQKNIRRNRHRNLPSQSDGRTRWPAG